jgi:prophage antirepressor-like protein
MKTSQTERQNDQLTPFSYEDHAVRTVLIDDSPWFVAKDVCDVLDIKQPTRAVEEFPQNEKGVTIIHTPGGKQEMLTVNEPGLYRLIFQSRKPEAEKFKTWVFTSVLPQVRRSGAFVLGGGQEDARRTAGLIYSRFIGCPDMNIQKINRLVYYLAVRPPLTQSDIAKLLGVNPTNVLEWKRRLPADFIERAAVILGLTVSGDALALDPRISHRKAMRKAAIEPRNRFGFPLELPEKEAGHGQSPS